MAEDKAKANAKAAVPTSSSGFNPITFMGEVNTEMKKVSWPNRRELVSYTLVVGLATFIVCVLVWACDAFFARLFELLLK